MGILVVTFPFIIKREHFTKLNKTPTILFAAFCIYLVINAVIFNRLEEDFVMIKKVLLSLGFVLLYIPIRDSKKINLAIVFSSLAIILFSVINIFIIINTSEDIVLGFSRQVIEALLIDRIYLGFIAILSILISYQALRQKFHPDNKYHLLIIIINVLFIFLMVSKIAVIILGLLLLTRQLYGPKKWIRFPIVLVILMGLSVLILSSTKVSTPLEDAAKKSFFERTLTWELRTEVWNCVNQINKTEGFILYGFGFEDTKNKLTTCYSDRIDDLVKKDEFVKSRYNTHNQFVDIYFNSGFIAIALFVLFLLTVFFKNRKKFIPTAFLIVLISYSMVENVFHRQIGAYYVGFVLIVILIQNQVSENKEEKKN
jgi:O-antigen ligase